jgi:hypothetical protein
MEMVITEISAREVVRFSREALGLPVPVNGEIDDPQIAGSIRRAAGILCPCSPSTLADAVLDSFRYLSEDNDDIAERVSAAVEALIICGDLLELNQVTIDDPLVKATWIFAAPPSFVQRPGGSIFLIGITPDAATPLLSLSRDCLPFCANWDCMNSRHRHGLRLPNQDRRQNCAILWIKDFRCNHSAVRSRTFRSSTQPVMLNTILAAG